MNARLGARHLARCLREMAHPLLAIAAYNAGPGMVNQWRAVKGRDRPLDAFIESIPVDETRGYVKRVTSSWVTYSALDGSLDAVRFPLDVK